jgi:hypothetical protein
MNARVETHVRYGLQFSNLVCFSVTILAFIGSLVWNLIFCLGLFVLSIYLLQLKLHSRMSWAATASSIHNHKESITQHRSISTQRCLALSVKRATFCINMNVSVSHPKYVCSRILNLTWQQVEALARTAVQPLAQYRNWNQLSVLLTRAFSPQDAVTTACPKHLCAANQ